MKTIVIESNKGKVNSSAVNSKAEKEKVNGLPVSSAFEDKTKEETPAVNAEVQKPHNENVQAQKTPVTEQPKAELTKMQIKEDLINHKPALSLEQTLLLIKDLADKTAHRATYTGYIDSLNKFIVSQNDDDMGKNDDPSFKGCELRIKDGEGNVFVTSSASVIFGTVEFMKGRFNERLAEVESEIVIPV